MRETGIALSGGQTVPLEQAAITMAIAVVYERVTKLSAADRHELYELVRELPRAKEAEEFEAIRAAMVEILDQQQGGIAELKLDDRPGKLQKWVDFVAGRVQRFRKEAGLTQVQLAEKTGLPQSHISRIESAKLSPSRATLEKIATAMNRTLFDLDPT